MDTNAVLSALSEATTAYHRVPELERELRTVTEDCDFTKLELEEARAEIERLKAQLNNYVNDLALANSTISQQRNDITDLVERNTSLDRSLADMTNGLRNANQTILERDQLIDLKAAEIVSLQSQLHDSRTITQRLKLAIESIGRKVVAACEEPEVSSSEPFPVSNPVAMPNPTDAEIKRVLSQPTSEPVAESTGTVVESVKPELEPTSSPGCYTSPIPAEKPWWER